MPYIYIVLVAEVLKPTSKPDLWRKVSQYPKVRITSRWLLPGYMFWMEMQLNEVYYEKEEV